MTKEEVIDRHFPLGVPFTENSGNHDFDLLHDVMDEYAKQQAKEFAKWTAINLWSVHGDNWYPYMDEDNPISASDLYELFIENQNKGNA